MVFIRKKKINGKDYAYLVRNRWTKDGSRQKAKYLGKLLSFSIIKELSLNDFIRNNYLYELHQFIRKSTKKEILKALIEHELVRRGFEQGIVKKADPKKEVLHNNSHYFKDNKIIKISTSKECIVEMNEGFLCSYSVDKLLKLKPIGYDEREKGIMLAKVLLEAGLKVERDVFVLIFDRWDR